MEEYSMKYDLFLAEQELYRNLIQSGAQVCLYENSNIEAIEEGVKETIKNYLNKVIEGIQKAWDKFKNTVGTAIDNKFLKPLAEKISGFKSSFQISNYPTINMNALNSLAIPQFDYERDKENLTSKESFLQAHFASIYQQGVSIKDSLKSKVITGYQDVVANKELLTQSFNFCVRDFLNAKNDMGKDLEIIDTTCKEIDSNLETVVSTSESAIYAFKSMKYRVLTEAEGDNDDQKMTFSDNDGEKTDPDDKEAQKSKTEFTKAVTTYMSTVCEVISAKMAILAEIFKSRMQVLKHFAEVIKQGITDKAEELKNKAGNASELKSINV